MDRQALDAQLQNKEHSHRQWFRKVSRHFLLCLSYAVTIHSLFSLSSNLVVLRLPIPLFLPSLPFSPSLFQTIPLTTCPPPHTHTHTCARHCGAFPLSRESVVCSRSLYLPVSLLSSFFSLPLPDDPSNHLPPTTHTHTHMRALLCCFSP